MIKTRHLLCIIAIFWLSTALRAQDSSAPHLEKFFQMVRQQPELYHPLPPLESAPQPFQILQTLKEYSTDSLSRIRKGAYQLAHQLVRGRKDAPLTMAAVNFLLKGYLDKDSGICGIVSNLLTQYSPEAFDAQARDQIKELLPLKPPYYCELIKLTGYVHPASAISLLEDLLATRSIQRPLERWTAKLALARMGHEKAIQSCLTLIRRQPVNDDLVYDILPDLIYTHQREAIDYLVELMNSDEKNCETADPDSEAMIPCAYRIMEYLVPLIENFPLQLGASGDVQTDNYEEALFLCRKWFTQNPDYSIITNQY